MSSIIHPLNIPGCPVVTHQQLPLLVETGLLAFGETGPAKYNLSRSQYYARLHHCNNTIFRFILHDIRGPVVSENIAGMLSLIPTHKGVYQRFSSGQISQFQFETDDILSTSQIGTGDIYLHTAYLNSHDFCMVKRLLSCLMWVMRPHLSDGKNGVRDVIIYGEGVSAKGQQIMDAFAMKAHGKSKEHNPVYMTRSNKIHPLVIQTPHKLLNRKLQHCVGL